MGIADEIEQWLKIQTDFVNKDHAPEQITERGKVKYRPIRGWYRKCHRCDYWQAHITESNSAGQIIEYFPETAHMCVRDGFIKDVRWPRF